MNSVPSRPALASAALSLLLSLSLAAPSHADVIGLDALHISDTFPTATLSNGSDLDEFRSTLIAEGHQLVSLSTFDAASLSGLDAVFLRNAFAVQNEYTAAERQALRKFVLDGGGMLFISEASSAADSLVSNTNFFLGVFGIEVGPGAVGPNGTVLSQFAKDPLVADIASIAVDFHRPMVTLDWPASDLTLSGGIEDALVSARLTPESGLFVSIGDGNLWADPLVGDDANIDSLDNRRLLQNITRALLEPNPCGTVSRLYGSATAAAPGISLPRLYSDCPPAGFGLRVCVDSGPALARGLLLIGLAETSVPLDGITQLVEPILAIPHQLDASGAWIQGVPVPSAPLLAGMPLYFQVGYGDSSSKLAASQALEWRP